MRQTYPCFYVTLCGRKAPFKTRTSLVSPAHCLFSGGSLAAPCGWRELRHPRSSSALCLFGDLSIHCESGTLR